MLIGGGKHDFAMDRVHCLGGIFHQIQDDLDQNVAIAPNRRQRGVIFFRNLQMGGKACLRDAPHMIQHLMDIDRPQFHGTFREDVEAIHQAANPVHLILDQQAKLLIRLWRVLFQQLRGTANARKRVFHLMRQHRRHGGGAARRAAKTELPVQHLRG